MKVKDYTIEALQDNLSPSTAYALKQYVNLVGDVVGVNIGARKIIREATLVHILKDMERMLDEMPVGKHIIIADHAAGFELLVVDEALRNDMQRLIADCRKAL